MTSRATIYTRRELFNSYVYDTGSERNMMSTIELAALVFQDHAAEFWATVSQSGPTGRPSVTCGATEGDLSLTRMHLNPYEDSECAGVDLIGEWTSSCVFAMGAHKLASNLKIRG